MEKDTIVEIEITDMAEDGSGIGRSGGYILFVKDSVIGDRIRAKVIKDKKSYGYGRLLEVLKPSEHRVQPLCSVAGPCGGCTLQALSYDKQLEFKKRRVLDLLKRIGKTEGFEMLGIAGMEEPYYYRNKAQFPVGRGRDGSIKIGFYAGHSHSIIEHDECFIENRINAPVTGAVRKWMEAYDVEPYDEKTGSGLVRHIFTRTGKSGTMVCLVINGKGVPREKELVSMLSGIPGITGICLNVNRKNTNVILGGTMKYLWGERFVEDIIGDIKYRISPLSFYQVNPVQTKVLYDTAREFAAVEKTDTVLDLYCGIGTIGLYMARDAGRVIGVEIIEDAVKDAAKNAELNGIDNAEFFCGKAEEVVPEIMKERRLKADIIIVDPPRKGCDKSLLEWIADTAPRRLVYISCDPATLARDVCILKDLGYGVEKVKCVDVFCHSTHVECVTLR
ncbi:MAG: 23S rRNA (uracil(1939)-C(5))-methyltransferase RlmD, partial [Lachnospiraceae bacterium]|nr:23S rRNA (uracil(1939)-C(5))-methyltransferase RlmD [Lachnospiraceae bacterium]